MNWNTCTDTGELNAGKYTVFVTLPAFRPNEDLFFSSIPVFVCIRLYCKCSDVRYGLRVLTRVYFLQSTVAKRVFHIDDSVSLDARTRSCVYTPIFMLFLFYNEERKQTRQRIVERTRWRKMSAKYAIKLNMLYTDGSAN